MTCKSFGNMNKVSLKQIAVLRSTKDEAQAGFSIYFFVCISP